MITGSTRNREEPHERHPVLILDDNHGIRTITMSSTF